MYKLMLEKKKNLSAVNKKFKLKAENFLNNTISHLGSKGK
jgi:hypothetical protein